MEFYRLSGTKGKHRVHISWLTKCAVSVVAKHVHCISIVYNGVATGYDVTGEWML